MIYKRIQGLLAVAVLIVSYSLVVLMQQTMAAPPCPCTVFADTDAPAANFTDTALEIGMKFRSDQNGFIKGIRFYKGNTNSGNYTANLWTVTGTNLASVTFTGQSTVGWQQVNFTTPISITANTVYVVSYFSPTGQYSATPSYFINAKDNAPLHGLANSESPNGVYSYSASSTFPVSTFNANNYWVDPVFDVTNTGTTNPIVTSVTPANGLTNVPKSDNITSFFNKPLATATVNRNTVQLLTPTGSQVATTVTYNNANNSITINPTAYLANNTKYTVTLKGGTVAPVIKDVANNALASNFTWSFTTGGTLPEEGPGGPILVIGSDTNLFSRYYSEIIRAEGFNLFGFADIAQLNAALLNPYDVVILGEMPLSTAQVTILENWVNAGGNLILMRPDKKLAALSGLIDLGTQLDNQYLKVDTAASPGAGIVSQTIQFHGIADLYALNGAAVTATLYSSDTTATTNPAVSLRSVGINGGQVGVFTYDLAKSIVFTHQGNPAWAGQERDGGLGAAENGVIRPNDLFYGNLFTDVKPDWVNLNKVAIPQADEQQRLLANMILQMNLDKKPLPRFWYLPGDKKAVIVHALDDHNTSIGTKDTFEKLKTAKPTNCSVADWDCFRATSWVFNGVNLTNTEAVAYRSAGFDIGSHVNTGCGNYTSQTALNSQFVGELSAFRAIFPGLPNQTGNRTHCIPWSDWLSTPKVELANGMRIDMNYYYWSSAWIQNRPGFMTGGGFPMRFADTNGTMVDVYQVPSLLVNENGFTYPTATNTVLDKAIGPEGYYGVFGTHDDYSQGSSFLDNLIVSAQSRNVAIVSADQMLKWTDGRNASTYKSIVWANNRLSFTVQRATTASNLTGMLPLNSSASTLQSLTRSGVAVTYTTKIIKGITYATFNATSGNYVATY
jgi:hypothetical protein